MILSLGGAQNRRIRGDGTETGGGRRGPGGRESGAKANGYTVSFGGGECSGTRWWWWRCNIVNALNGAKLPTLRCLGW